MAHVIDNVELVITSKALNAQPIVIHVNHNLKML